MRLASVDRIALLSMSLALVALVALVADPRSSIWGLPAIGGWWAIGCAGVGFVIARRQPRNRIGWQLGPVYVPGVFVVHSILPGKQTNLAAAGLLTLLDHPIQGVVDHGLNRSHYEAERVIKEFAGGIRNQVDLGGVASGPRVVLDRTIQPVTTEIRLRSQP